MLQKRKTTEAKFGINSGIYKFELVCNGFNIDENLRNVR